MMNEYVHNNLRDPAEEIFERLEAQVFDISRNMNVLMAFLETKLGPFKDDGGSNLKNKLEGKSKYQEDSRKESHK
jgi:hypothetical protein